MTVCDHVDIRHIPRVQAESPDSRFQYRFQHLSELHRLVELYPKNTFVLNKDSARPKFKLGSSI